MQFEYLTFSCPPSVLQDELNNHARAGWRVVSVIAPTHVSKPIVCAVMERLFQSASEGDKPEAMGMRG